MMDTLNYFTMICQVNQGFDAGQDRGAWMSEKNELRNSHGGCTQYCFNALLTVGNKPNKLEVMTSQKPKGQGK